MWISLSDSSCWRLQLKVTHLVQRHAKVVQMKSGTFCTALSLFIRVYSICVYVWPETCFCICIWQFIKPIMCMCVAECFVTVEAAATVSADGSYVCLAWVTQRIYHSSAACVMKNTFLPLDLYTQTHTFHKFISSSVWQTNNICTFTQRHKSNLQSCRLRGYQNLPYSNTDYLSYSVR